MGFSFASMLSVIKLTSDWTLATSPLHLISLQYAVLSAYMLRLEFLEMDALSMVSTIAVDQGWILSSSNAKAINTSS